MPPKIAVTKMDQFNRILSEITETEAYIDVDFPLTQEATHAFAQTVRERQTKTLRVRRGFSVERARQLADILQDNPFVTTLDLSYQEINNDAATIVAAALLRSNSAVQKLDLQEIFIHTEALRILLRATHSKALRKLKLVIAWDQVPLVNTVRIITETALDENSSIETFDFGLYSMTTNGALDSTCANLIATSYRFRFLISLFLHHTDMDAEAAMILGKGLSENYVLKDLVLQNNPLGDIGARSIAQGLTNNTTLENLDFSHCGIHGDGTRALCSSLWNKPNMRTLSLSNNRVGDQGMDAIANSGLLNLLQLFVASCDIGDDGAESLSRFLQQSNVQLNFLDLMNNQIGTQGMIALARALHSNQSVSTLILQLNPYDNYATSVALADMLRNNSTLSYLELNSDTDDNAFEVLLGGLRQNGSLIVLAAGYTHMSNIMYKNYARRNRDAHQRAREAAMQLALLGIQRFPTDGDPDEDAQFLKSLQEKNSDEYETTLVLRRLLRETGRTGLRRGLFTKAAWYLWKSRAEPVWWTPAQRRDAGLETEEEKQSDPKKSKRIEAACIQCQNEARWEEKDAPSRLFCGTYCQWLQKTGMPDLRGKSARAIRQLMKAY